MQKIPFKKINLGKAKEAVAPLLESGFIGLGNVVYEFEKELAEYVGAKEVVAFDSCTSAIFISLMWRKMHGFKGSAEIPSMTVPLVANALAEAQVPFVFNDLTEWVGNFYRIEPLNIIDSAHCLVRDQLKKMIEQGVADDFTQVCFSFYPTKTIGTADGGAVATNDMEFANWARQVITYGRNQRKQYANSWDYDVEMMGYKRHWTNLQAAIALEQLRRLDQTTMNRRRVKDAYNQSFGLNVISDYLYRINVTDRDAFIAEMAEQGIECGVHFKPLHLMTPFQGIPVQGRVEIEKAYKHTVSLPFYDLMSNGDVERVISAVWGSKYHKSA